MLHLGLVRGRTRGRWSNLGRSSGHARIVPQGEGSSRVARPSKTYWQAEASSSGKAGPRRHPNNPPYNLHKNRSLSFPLLICRVLFIVGPFFFGGRFLPDSRDRRFRQLPGRPRAITPHEALLTCRAVGGGYRAGRIRRTSSRQVLRILRRSRFSSPLLGKPCATERF